MLEATIKKYSADVTIGTSTRTSCHTGLAEKAKLYTGNREEWDEDIFNVNWERFLDQVTRSSDPGTYRPFRVRELDVTISFAIGQGGGGSRLVHEQINNLIRNRIVYALRKKADQLAAV